MTLKGMYQNFAERHKIADQFGSITQSHAVAIEQIQSAMVTQHLPVKVLDLGMGNGAFLQQLMPILKQAQLTGIDISPDMIKLAQNILPIRCIEASATEASNYLPKNSHDLVLAHFINAYIPIDTLFKEAQTLTRKNGYYSMITTTYESFPVAQEKIAKFISEGSIVGRVVGHYYKNLVRNATVASGKEELLNTLNQYGFEIIEHQRLEIPVKMASLEQLIQFGIDGTWFLNTLSVRMLPKQFLAERLKKLFDHIFTFPYCDTHIIDVVLAQKKDPPHE